MYNALEEKGKPSFLSEKLFRLPVGVFVSVSFLHENKTGSKSRIMYRVRFIFSFKDKINSVTNKILIVEKKVHLFSIEAFHTGISDVIAELTAENAKKKTLFREATEKVPRYLKGYKKAIKLKVILT